MRRNRRVEEDGNEEDAERSQRSQRGMRRRATRDFLTSVFSNAKLELCTRWPPRGRGRPAAPQRAVVERRAAPLGLARWLPSRARLAAQPRDNPREGLAPLGGGLRWWPQTVGALT